MGEKGVFDSPPQLQSRSHESVVSSLKEVIMGQGQELQIMTQPPLVVETGEGMEVNHLLDCSR